MVRDLTRSLINNEGKKLIEISSSKYQYKSPSLSIMKPNINSMISIFNRIIGVLLFFIILIYTLYSSWNSPGSFVPFSNIIPTNNGMGNWEQFVSGVGIDKCYSEKELEEFYLIKHNLGYFKQYKYGVAPAYFAQFDLARLAMSSPQCGGLIPIDIAKVNIADTLIIQDPETGELIKDYLGRKPLLDTGLPVFKHTYMVANTAIPTFPKNWVPLSSWMLLPWGNDAIESYGTLPKIYYSNSITGENFSLSLSNDMFDQRYSNHLKSWYYLKENSWGFKEATNLSNNHYMHINRENLEDISGIYFGDMIAPNNELFSISFYKRLYDIYIANLLISNDLVSNFKESILPYFYLKEWFNLNSESPLLSVRQYGIMVSNSLYCNICNIFSSITWLYVSIFLLFILLYHTFFGSLKIFMKSSKIYQTISSDIKIIDILYLDLLKLVIIITIVMVILIFSGIFFYGLNILFVGLFLSKLLLLKILKIKNKLI